MPPIDVWRVRPDDEETAMHDLDGVLIGGVLDIYEPAIEYVRGWQYFCEAGDERSLVEV